jgi:hypothetical protein
VAWVILRPEDIHVDHTEGTSMVARKGDRVGALTRHPGGLLGQPFYGWFTTVRVFLQAASAAFYLYKAVETASGRFVAPSKQP